jgi:hypothetical protein
MNISSKLNNIINIIEKSLNKIPTRYLIIGLIAIIFLITAIFIIVDFEDNDTLPPNIEVLSESKAISTYDGTTITIYVNFSDNVKVTDAQLFYKPVNEKNFSSKSIINKSAILIIPPGTGENYEFYVTVNDAAGNGPVGDPSIDGSRTYIITVVERENDSNESNDDVNIRYVFIEESTATTCKYCPDVADILDELYTSGNHRFFYVSMVDDNPKAKSRLDEYNYYGNPSVFVDGGYQVIVGAKDKLYYQDAIQNAHRRTTANLTVELTTEIKESNNDVSVKVDLTNNENNPYEGTLRIYVTETRSNSLQDYNGKPYKYSFIDFAKNKKISISSNNKISETATIADTDKHDPEDLTIFAVVFGNEKNQAYANPPNENPFDAYYVDACYGISVVEGANLAPNVSISTPQSGKVYILGNKINLLDSLTLPRSILIGACDITAVASDEDGIERVELYIDNQLIKEFLSEPYIYTYKNTNLFQFKHTITFIAYDMKGKSATSSRDIFALTLKEKT